MNFIFNNSSIVSVNSGTIILNVSGKTRTFVDAKLVSAVDGKIVLDLPTPARKNGSYLVIRIDDKVERIFILNPYRKCCMDYHVSQRDNQIVYNEYWVVCSHVRNATPEEIQELNDQLAAEGKRWNPNTMQIEKLRWKPLYNEKYYCVTVLSGVVVASHVWNGDTVDCDYYNTNNCFKTKEEAEAKLEQIKQILNSTI